MSESRTPSRVFIVEHRKLGPRKRKAKPPRQKPPPRLITPPRRPIEGAPRMRSGGWDWHQRPDPEGEEP